MEETIKGVVWSFCRGFYDSIRGIGTLLYLDKEMNDRLRNRHSPSRANTPIRRRESDINKDNASTTRTLKKHEESKVLKLTIHCGILNGGIFLVSLLLFDWGILPLINFILNLMFGQNSFMSNTIWSWIRPFLTYIFQTMWVLPLFTMSKVVNSLWFQDIADLAYRYSRGRPQIDQSISKVVADSFFSIGIQFLFLIQAILVELIPIYLVGKLFSIVHMCLLYSLYAFEYKWINMGWELHKRLTFIETNWPYFVGFGLPLAILTQISESWVINGCICSILFPLFIVSGHEANPVTNVRVYPLHLFSPVVAVLNGILNTFIGDKKIKKTNQLIVPTKSTQYKR